MTAKDAQLLADLIVKIASTDSTVAGGFYCRLLGNTLVIDGHFDLTPEEGAALGRNLDGDTVARLGSAGVVARHHDQTLDRRTTSGA